VLSKAPSVCIVHLPSPGVSPQHLLGVNNLEDTPTERHFTCSCGSALYGMSFRNDGQSTRHGHGPGQPGFPAPRGDWCGVQRGMSWRSFSSFAICAIGNWSPRQARLFISPARSATRFAEDSLSLSLRVAGCFSLSISHASGAWPSEMKPRGGSSRYAAGDGHMTKVTDIRWRRLCSWPAEMRIMWMCSLFRRQYPVDLWCRTGG